MKKALETVWRDGLWYKVLMCNIKRKMYKYLKLRIVYADYVSNFFQSLNGDRQGDHASLASRHI